MRCSSNDTVEPEEGRDPALATGTTAEDELVAPTFARHAAGTLKASLSENAPTIYCRYQVERDGEGAAKVTITRPDQSLLIVEFAGGKAIKAGIGSLSNPIQFSATKTGDLNVIEVSGQRFGIPDYVVYRS